MTLLLDTHALLWSATSSDRVPRQTLEIIGATERVFVSAVSAYELTLEAKLGKLDGAEQLLRDFSGYLKELEYESLSVSISTRR